MPCLKDMFFVKVFKKYAVGSQLSRNMSLLRTASLSCPLVICQSQLGFFYKYSAFSMLSILMILLDKCQTKSFEGNEHSTQSNSRLYVSRKNATYIYSTSKCCFSFKVNKTVTFNHKLTFREVAVCTSIRMRNIGSLLI